MKKTSEAEIIEETVIQKEIEKLRKGTDRQRDRNREGREVRRNPQLINPLNRTN